MNSSELLEKVLPSLKATCLDELESFPCQLKLCWGYISQQGLRVHLILHASGEDLESKEVTRSGNRDKEACTDIDEIGGSDDLRLDTTTRNEEIDRNTRIVYVL